MQRHRIILRVLKSTATLISVTLALLFAFSLYFNFGYFRGSATLVVARGCLSLVDYPSVVAPRGWFVDSLDDRTFDDVMWLPVYYGGGRGSLPLWIPLVVVLGLTMGIYRWDRRRSLGFCRQCGYDLRGSPSGRCPECGTQVRLALPTTSDAVGSGRNSDHVRIK